MAFGGQGPAVAASVTSEQLPKKKGKPAEETSEPGRELRLCYPVVTRLLGSRLRPGGVFIICVVGFSSVDNGDHGRHRLAISTRVP
jgi:hypothetical protein